MNKKLQWVLLVLGIAMFLVSACSQKPPAEEAQPPVQEVEPPPPPPPPPKVEEPPPPPVELNLETVYFDFDKYNLKPDAREALGRNARLLKENPEATVLIEGHCDERGTKEYNLALGEKRAKSARDYLVDLGVAASRIRIISYGKERPVDPGHNEAAWAKNRRAAFIRTDS